MKRCSISSNLHRSVAPGLKLASRKIIPLERPTMKNTPFSLAQLSKPTPAKKVPARHEVKKARPAKPTPWGQGVLKKIEEFRLALASEK